jgi:transposase
VIDVATLSVIRRWALREQMSIREIARRTGLSRNTVKKYLRAGEEAPRYAKRASSSKLDPYADKLATWLTIEATKSRKQRRNLRQIHTLNPKRRTSSTYPHRDAFGLTKRVGHYSMEISGQRSVEFNRTGL